MKAAVIGYPIAHSKSPLIHSYWCKKHYISGAYEAIEIKPENLKSDIQAMVEQGYDGFNVTAPHKEAVLALCDHLDETAQSIGAVNTVIIKEGKLYGKNTDAFGFIQNLKTKKPDFIFLDKTALVLGAGGAAKAVIYALIKEGVPKIYLTNRTIEKAEILSQQFPEQIKIIPWEEKESVLNQSNLLVNTTSLGMVGKPSLEVNIAALPKNSLITDIVYAPLMTDLLLQAAQKDFSFVTGIGMLLHQARPAFEAWGGVLPDIDEDLEALVLA